VIVSLDGEPVKDVTSFRNRVAMIRPETSVKLEVLRDGQKQSVSLQVGKLPDSDSVASGGKQTVDSSWGLSVQTLTEQLASQLGLDRAQGVVVTNVNPMSAAAAAGIRPGMVVTEVNRTPVRNAQEFDAAVQSNPDADTLLLLVQAGGHTQYLVLEKR